VQSLADTHRPGVVSLGGLTVARLIAEVETGPRRCSLVRAASGQHVTLFLTDDPESQLPLLFARALSAIGADVRIAMPSDGRRPDRVTRASGRGPGRDSPAALWRDLETLGVMRALRQSTSRDPVVYVLERVKRQVERAPPAERGRAKILAFEAALSELARVPGPDAAAVAADLRNTLRVRATPITDLPTVSLVLPGHPCEPSCRCHPLSDPVTPISSRATPRRSPGMHC
jgi:hypothetical protein